MTDSKPRCPSCQMIIDPLGSSPYCDACFILREHTIRTQPSDLTTPTLDELITLRSELPESTVRSALQKLITLMINMEQRRIERMTR